MHIIVGKLSDLTRTSSSWNLDHMIQVAQHKNDKKFPVIKGKRLIANNNSIVQQIIARKRRQLNHACNNWSVELRKSLTTKAEFSNWQNLPWIIDMQMKKGIF